jgi:hypothetical protein
MTINVPASLLTACLLLAACSGSGGAGRPGDAGISADADHRTATGADAGVTRLPDARSPAEPTDDAPSCVAAGAVCDQVNPNCCTGACLCADPLCDSPATCGCVASGVSCTKASACCSGSCTNGLCGGACLASGAGCTGDSDCCSGACGGLNGTMVCGAAAAQTGCWNTLLCVIACESVARQSNCYTNETGEASVDEPAVETCLGVACPSASGGVCDVTATGFSWSACHACLSTNASETAGPCTVQVSQCMSDG